MQISNMCCIYKNFVDYFRKIHKKNLESGTQKSLSSIPLSIVSLRCICLCVCVQRNQPFTLKIK